MHFSIGRNITSHFLLSSSRLILSCPKESSKEILLKFEIETSIQLKYISSLKIDKSYHRTSDCVICFVRLQGQQFVHALQLQIFNLLKCNFSYTSKCPRELYDRLWHCLGQDSLVEVRFTPKIFCEDLWIQKCHPILTHFSLVTLNNAHYTFSRSVYWVKLYLKMDVFV